VLIKNKRLLTLFNWFDFNPLWDLLYEPYHDFDSFLYKVSVGYEGGKTKIEIHLAFYCNLNPIDTSYCIFPLLYM